MSEHFLSLSVRHNIFRDTLKLMVNHIDKVIKYTKMDLVSCYKETDDKLLPNIFCHQETPGPIRTANTKASKTPTNELVTWSIYAYFI